jgi:hypothetical protein
MSRGFFLRIGCKMPAVIVRYLEYIVALSRERHFARAAAACNVTQSLPAILVAASYRFGIPGKNAFVRRM